MMPSEFISVAEARDLITKHTEVLSPVKVSLMDSAGLVLSENIIAKTDVPPFNQSSMDGYAFNYEGWKRYGQLKIEGEVAAGSTKTIRIEPQNTARIFTGAAVPEGADTVVMQEKIKVSTGMLLIEDDNLTKGLNFRARGCEVNAGAL